MSLKINPKILKYKYTPCLKGVDKPFNTMNEILISFEGDYINSAALEELYDFSQNKFITKSAPGIGVTTALLNYTGGNLIVISPLTPMIKKKSYDSLKYTSDQQFFKCTGLVDNWRTVYSYLSTVPFKQQNMVINCTPDAICWVLDHYSDLFDKLVHIPVVVDEYDNVIFQSSLRDECGRFLELLFNWWRNNFTLTTATPNYKFIDVPPELNIQHIKIGPIQQKANTLMYSSDLKDAFTFIRKEVDEGRKVACFSNNSKVHKKQLSKLQSSMVGRNLELKLESYGVKTEEQTNEELFDTNDVVIFSGKYFIGFDIDKDISIVVISEAGHAATTTPLSQVIQALYRCRGTLHNSLFVNTRLRELNYPIQNYIDHEIESFQEEINFVKIKASRLWDSHQINKSDPITKELFCNRSALATKALSQIYFYQLHDKGFIQKYFNEYGYDVIPYLPPRVEELVAESVKFNERIQNLMGLDPMVIEQRYKEVVEKLKFSKQGTHNPMQVMERLTALLLSMLNDHELLEKLQKKNVKRGEYYDYLDKFFQRNFPCDHFTQFKKRSDQALRQIRVADALELPDNFHLYLIHWHLFYAVHRASQLDFPPDAKRYFLIRAAAADGGLIKELKDNGKTLSTVLEVIMGKMQENFEPLSNLEVSTINKIVSQGFENPLGVNFLRNTRKSLLKAYTESLLFLINPKAEFEEKNNRESNPFSNLSKIFHPGIPFEMISIDLVSANAQFIDRILCTEMYKEVYHNISRHENISREEAKKLFNRKLNSHFLKQSEAEHFYHKVCGYDLVQAKRLAKMTAGVPAGTFYSRMTRLEKDIIDTYNSHMNWKGIRLHDSLLFLPWNLDSAPLQFLNNYEFSIGYFNVEKPYKGEIINENKMISILPFK